MSVLLNKIPNREQVLSAGYHTISRYYGDNGACDELETHANTAEALGWAKMLSEDLDDKAWVDIVVAGTLVAQAKQGEVRTPTGEEYV